MPNLGMLGALGGAGKGLSEFGKMGMAERVAANRDKALAARQDLRQATATAAADLRQDKSIASSEGIAAQAEEGRMARHAQPSGTNVKGAKEKKVIKLTSEISKVEDQLAKLSDSELAGDEKPAELERAKAKLLSLQQQLRIASGPKSSGKFKSFYADPENEPPLVLQSSQNPEPYNLLQ